MDRFIGKKSSKICHFCKNRIQEEKSVKYRMFYKNTPISCCIEKSKMLQLIQVCFFIISCFVTAQICVEKATTKR